MMMRLETLAIDLFVMWYDTITISYDINTGHRLVGCVAQLAERRSFAVELTLSCSRPAADGWPLCG